VAAEVAPWAPVRGLPAQLPLVQALPSEQALALEPPAGQLMHRSCAPASSNESLWCHVRRGGFRARWSGCGRAPVPTLQAAWNFMHAGQRTLSLQYQVLSQLSANDELTTSAPVDI
jgi:hypothetical protein